MIFVIMILFTILCFILRMKTSNDLLEVFGELGCVFGLIISVIMVCIIFAMNVGIDAQIDAMNTERDMLVYQYENSFYDNDNDIGKRELIKEIQEWNKDLVYLQGIQNNFWVGIFVPNIYDQFDLISLETSGGEQE